MFLLCVLSKKIAFAYNERFAALCQCGLNSTELNFKNETMNTQISLFENETPHCIKADVGRSSSELWYQFDNDEYTIKIFGWISAVSKKLYRWEITDGITCEFDSVGAFYSEEECLKDAMREHYEKFRH